MLAALVADIYSQQVVQGPSMPAAQRSMLTQVYAKNPELWVSRLHAGLDEARHRRRCQAAPHPVLQPAPCAGRVPLPAPTGAAADGSLTRAWALQLRNQPTVDPSLLAAYGYCFGGGGAIQLMLSYPNNTEGLLGALPRPPPLPERIPDVWGRLSGCTPPSCWCTQAPRPPAAWLGSRRSDCIVSAQHLGPALQAWLGFHPSHADMQFARPHRGVHVPVRRWALAPAAACQAAARLRRHAPAAALLGQAHCCTLAILPAGMAAGACAGADTGSGWPVPAGATTPSEGLFFLGYLDKGAPRLTTVANFEASAAAHEASAGQRSSHCLALTRALTAALCAVNPEHGINASWALVSLGQTVHAFTGAPCHLRSARLPPRQAAGRQGAAHFAEPLPDTVRWLESLSAAADWA